MVQLIKMEEGLTYFIIKKKFLSKLHLIKFSIISSSAGNNHLTSSHFYVLIYIIHLKFTTEINFSFYTTRSLIVQKRRCKYYQSGIKRGSWRSESNVKSLIWIKFQSMMVQSFDVALILQMKGLLRLHY